MFKVSFQILTGVPELNLRLRPSSLVGRRRLPSETGHNQGQMRRPGAFGLGPCHLGIRSPGLKPPQPTNQGQVRQPGRPRQIGRRPGAIGDRSGALPRIITTIKDKSASQGGWRWPDWGQVPGPIGDRSGDWVAGPRPVAVHGSWGQVRRSGTFGLTGRAIWGSISPGLSRAESLRPLLGGERRQPIGLRPRIEKFSHFLLRRE